MKTSLLRLPLVRFPSLAPLLKELSVFRWFMALRNMSTVTLLTTTVALAAQAFARAQDTTALTTLHSFNGSDGSYPQGELAQGNDGNFYGTAKVGANGDGTVYRISSAGIFTTLYQFNGSDGDAPVAGLVQGSDGNFYGVTYSGGVYGYSNGQEGNGTLFRLTPAGLLTTLYNFTGGNDGLHPYAALTQGSDGNFYGTTEEGGANGTYGTVFRITPAGAFTTLHSFGFGDGAAPHGQLAQGSDGNFYGTTESGGDNGLSSLGTVFVMTPSGALTTLYSFDDGIGGTPEAGVVQGSDGSFYGTTSGLGENNDSGTVFKLTSTGAFTNLHSFDSFDGGGSHGRLLLGRDGNFYGTAGSVFQLTPAGVFTNLTNSLGTIFDGASYGLVQDKDSNFYSTSFGDNTSSSPDGSIFKLVVYPSFFSGEVTLSNGVYYLAFPSENYFGYYTFLSDPSYIYHYDLGYEYVLNANDGKSGVYFYDFKSNDFFYTSPAFPFPYLYDFNLKTVVYYYPDPNNANRYNTNGVRYFYNFATGQVISK